MLGLQSPTLAFNLAVSPGAVRDTARRCCDVAVQQCAEGLADARAARRLHGFTGAPGLPDLRGAGESGRTARLHPSRPGLTLSVGSCHVASAHGGSGRAQASI